MEGGGGHVERRHLLGHDGEHGLAREVVCSLPRSFGCRVCPGERDCPFIVDRPFGHLVVHRREPVRLVAPAHEPPGTGSRCSAPPHPGAQVLVATLGWLAVLGFVLWWWVLRPPSAADVAVPLALKLAVFVFVVVGVPLVRSSWRDRRRRDARGDHGPVGGERVNRGDR